MATMNSIIDYTDRLKPNVYTDEDKYLWISKVDEIISTEVHQTDVVKYTLPEDAEKKLLVPAPYDDLYTFYVSAMIDFYNKEYTHYNNSVLMFKERLEQYKAWYISKNPVCKANNFRNVMG